MAVFFVLQWKERQFYLKLDRKCRFLLKNYVEVLDESEPWPFNIMEGMLSLLLSNYNHVHNMITVFKHNGNFMPFPPFYWERLVVSHNRYFFLYNFRFPYSFPGFNSLFLCKISFRFLIFTVSLLILRTLSVFTFSEFIKKELLISHNAVFYWCKYNAFGFLSSLDFKSLKKQLPTYVLQNRLDVLKTFAEFTENYVFLSLFQPETLLKNRSRHMCFPVNFVKILRINFSQGTFGRLRNPLKTNISII